MTRRVTFLMVARAFSIVTWEWGTQGQSSLLNWVGSSIIRGLIFKRNSSGGGLQAPRQALLEIIAESGLAADDIAEIQVEMRPSDN